MRLLFFLIFFSTQVLGSPDLEIINEAPGPTPNHPGTVNKLKYRPAPELAREMKRQDAEFKKYLDDRDEKHQKILDRGSEKIDPSKFFPQTHQHLSTSESNKLVDRALRLVEQNRIESVMVNFQVTREYSYATLIDRDSKEGNALYDALTHRNNVAATLSSCDPLYKEKAYLIYAADSSLDLAVGFYQNGHHDEGDFARNLSIGFADIALNFIPGVSWGRDLYESIIGKDMVHGTDLDVFDRSLAILGVATGGLGSKIGVGMKVLGMVSTSNIVLNFRKYNDSLVKAERIAKSANKFEVSPEKVKKYAIDLASPSRKNHILYGEITPRGYSGGHLHPGQPGKTVFPQSWSGDKIMHETSDIVTDPSVTWKRQNVEYSVPADFDKKGRPSRFEATGIRDDVEIKVIIEPAGEGIISSYPLKGPGVFTNPL